MKISLILAGVVGMNVTEDVENLKTFGFNFDHTGCPS